ALCDDSTPCDKNQKDKDIVDADGNKIKTPSAPTMTRARCVNSLDNFRHMIGQQWYENESDAAAAGTSAQAATLCTECRIFPLVAMGKGCLAVRVVVL
ncbi:unnamed protein product, partial [Durusdinium trenchii]